MRSMKLKVKRLTDESSVCAGRNSQAQALPGPKAGAALARATAKAPLHDCAALRPHEARSVNGTVAASGSMLLVLRPL
jgi:hypothetical protein